MPKSQKLKTLGETISEARKRAGFTLRNLAPRVPINFVYLSEIEKDKNTPSEKVLQGLADIPELELDYDILMSLAGKIDEQVYDYLKKQPLFGKILRQIVEENFDQSALEYLQESLHKQIYSRNKAK